MNVVEALRRTYEDNCAKIRRGEEPSGVHICFICSEEFRIDEATYCPQCNWWRTSGCHHCGCDLGLEARVELEKAFREVCGGVCQLNPKKRKSSNIIKVSKSDFLSFCSKLYRGYYDDYNAGRITFDELKNKVEIETGLIWIFE